MPKLIGRFERSVKRRFPRFATWVGDVNEDYGHSIRIGAVLIFISATVGLIAYLGIELNNAGEDIDQVKGDVQVFQQNTPCTPRPDGQPTNKAQCRENFNTTIQRVLTPLQACEFLKRGASLITIGGRPIPPVTCVPPAPRVETNDEATGGSTTATSDSSVDSQEGGSGSPGGGGQTGQPDGDGGSPGGGSPDGDDEDPGQGEGPGEGSAPEEPGESPAEPQPEPEPEEPAAEPAGERPFEVNLPKLPVELEVCTPLARINCQP